MITEDYVSFETSKLLKEKGFDEPCQFLYFSKYKQEGDFIGNFNAKKNSEINEASYSAPTLQMAMKWLREVHYYNIEIDTLGMMELNTLSWRSAVYYLVNENECYCEHGFDSYEEACEAAIKYCLENLI